MDPQPYLAFLAAHPFSVVFLSALVEAAGVPFPSRLILVLTPAFLMTETDLVRLILVGTVGAVLGDHVPYLAGRLAGTRLLGFYCRVTLASDACVEKTLRYFDRFGPAALLFSRFSASVRMFAAACAGCARMTYARYVGLDTVGTLAYTTLWALVGWFIGERAVTFLTTDRRRWIFVGAVGVAFVTLISYRLWRRWRYGRAQAKAVEVIREQPGCAGGDRARVHHMKEALMTHAVRINLASPAELLELPSVGPEQARAILDHRTQHGPIRDAKELATILRPWPIAPGMWDQVDFAPAEATAPEAPGA